jgi:N-acyl homoserine lactone hydrolase
VLVAVKNGFHQPGQECIQLTTGIAQAGHLNDRCGTDIQKGAPREAQEADATGSDVLPHLARFNIEAAFTKLVVELGLDQVNLSQVRLARVGPEPGAVLHGHPGVRVVVHTDTGHKPDAVRIRLAQLVHSAPADRHDFPNACLPVHPAILTGQMPHTCAAFVPPRYRADMRTDDITRLLLGTFVRPEAETGTGTPRVEAVYGYLVRHERGLVLLDTGLGHGDPETESWYRPRRVALADALRDAGVLLNEIDVVVNCHLHFDHCGGNPLLAGAPVVCQRTELAAAQQSDYTMEHLIDYPGSRYDLLDGEAEIHPGIHVIPTPGHVAGHQSLVVRCEDGSVVLAGQSHDSASAWSAEVLAASATSLGHREPLPVARPWVDRLLAFDPKRVVFAHDAAVWEPC